MTKAVPQYPRPVPSISADEAPICSTTVVYERWTDEAEREERERAAKRGRTIEEAAASYLRGEPLFILTASLRGPFDGWKNPWARKRQKHGDGAEIVAEKAGVESAPRKRIVPAITAGGGSGGGSSEGGGSGGGSEGGGNSSAEKVADWLRKTDDPAPSTAGNEQSSPTPGAKEGLHLLSDSEYQSAAAWRSGEAPAGQAGLGQPFSFLASYQSAGSEDESPRRAEAAIISYKRRSGQRVSSSTHQPQFEYHKPRRRRVNADEAMPGANDRRESSDHANRPRDPRSLHHPDSVAVVAAQGEQSKTTTAEGHSTSKPALSNEASNVVHSAQVVASAPRLAMLASDVHSTEEILHSAPLLTPNENHTTSTCHAAEQQSAYTCDSEKENEPAAKDRSESGHLPAQVDDEPTNSLDQTPVRELDSPEMMLTVKPIDLGTTKKKPLNEKIAASPTSSPRANRDATMMRQRGKKVKTNSVKTNAQPAAHALETGDHRGGGDEGGDDSFDLDLAMDELGSYLGTWDPEVEAQKLTH
ncbi:hypothetical protein DV737_g3259, partial [Chaetothyriales sp. CBS 132003]